MDNLTPQLDWRTCFNCDDPLFAHHPKLGCSGERIVETEMDIGLTTCGCASPQLNPIQDPELQARWRPLINNLVDTLGCTRHQAATSLLKAQREGYEFS